MHRHGIEPNHVPLPYVTESPPMPIPFLSGLHLNLWLRAERDSKEAFGSTANRQPKAGCNKKVGAKA